MLQLKVLPSCTLMREGNMTTRDADLTKELQAKSSNLLYRPMGGVYNRVPPDFGPVTIKTVVGFGFNNGTNETREGPYAGNGQDSLVVANHDGCCEVIAVTLWANGEKFPNPLICRPPPNECLIRNTWTLAPKKSVGAIALKSNRLSDLLEAVEDE